MSSLKDELKKLEGILYQNPETGAKGQDSYLGDYTNRIFGAPYQLLESVDMRFDDVNSYLGNEYLRNFILNSSILHIRPGMPKYTGETNRAKGIGNAIKSLYMDTVSGNMNLVESLIMQLSQSTIFSQGSKLQRRMFGFRETYYDYMQHVNYMCRSEAILLNLTSNDRFPSGTFVNSGGGGLEWEDFSTLKWENYRLLKSSTVLKPTQLIAQYRDATLLGPIWAVAEGLGDVTNIVNWINRGLVGDLSTVFSDPYDNIKSAFAEASHNTIGGRLNDKISSVEFMVEPLGYEESLGNKTKQSMIESAVDAIREGVGSEIGFITNSDASFGMLDGIMDFLGNTAESAAMSLTGITRNLTGGFMSNLFSGAVQSIKGQKMIYPEIYESSDGEFNYSYSITLTSPYGDVYNYYMNIVVPLMHLIALAAPRLVSSNSTTSPYMIQCYVPGQCTCHLGIISNMTIHKNPDGNHVSVNGFPLTVKVTFQIKELYNAMAISPANDPSSFLFNETLNDYLANMAGLIPSVDTYTKQRQAMLQNLNEYIAGGGFIEDFVSNFVEDVEDIVNPFVGR